MNEKDKKIIINRYEERLKKWGPVQKSLGWFKGRQKYRFYFLKEIDNFELNDSVLDVGCGYGDLSAYLKDLGWKGKYCGIDIVPGLIEIARKKYPEEEFHLLDLQIEKFEFNYDWIFCSGALTTPTTDIDSYQHLEEMLRIFYSICIKGISVNFFSPLVDYVVEGSFHPEFHKLIEIVTKFSKRFTIRHDYMPYEYTLYIYKQDNINKEVNIYAAHNNIYENLKVID